MNIVFLCNALLKVEKSIIVKLGHNTQVTVNITNMHAHSPEPDFVFVMQLDNFGHCAAL